MSFRPYSEESSFCALLGGSSFFSYSKEIVDDWANSQHPEISLHVTIIIFQAGNKILKCYLSEVMIRFKVFKLHERLIQLS
jgi:hypothetical protein